MQINVRFLENLRLEALFDDFNVITDQPIRYKGDGTAPGPFDYFLASSALCAAYFVKVYCKARAIPTDDIKITQDNIVDPENRYKQTFNIQVELPESLSEKDKEGIIRSIDRCTVKKTIEQGPLFQINAKTILGVDENPVFNEFKNQQTKTNIIGKDCSLEETINNMTSLLEQLGMKVEIHSWRNPLPNVWSVHIRDADSPMCFSNGKGASKDAALCSALGEFLERLSTNYFYADFFLGKEVATQEFVHYPSEKWFSLPEDDSLPKELMDEHMLRLYNPGGELKASHLVDTNSGNKERGICALAFERQSDGSEIYIPVNLIGNLFVSNGMSAGNSKFEARSQALSEIFERAVKEKIILEEISLPDVPSNVLEKYPKVLAGIKELENKGFPVLVKDASLGGRFPVMCVTLMNPRTGGVFVSFGAHPSFEVALERSLTELLQGRSFEGLNDVPPPTFNEAAIKEHNNIVEHFIDSTGVVSWKFFSAKSEYDFYHWDFSGSTEEEFQYLMDIMKNIEKEVYIADYDHLGANACRILVPGYSEIYQVDDLIWDNNNEALNFREDILNIHHLSDSELDLLVQRLEESEIDNFMPISELIGVAFDENSIWGQLVIGELKCLIYLALKKYEDCRVYTELFFTFNENSPQRRKYYQILNALVEIELRDEMKREDYLSNFIKMYGIDLVKTAQDSVDGKIKFYGLTKTDINLVGINKHLELIKSYTKLHKIKKS